MQKFTFTYLLLLAVFTGSVFANDKQAPEWELKDANGQIVRSSDFKGKPLVIHFWATWCPYCKKLQPGLQALHEEYSGKGLNMIAISFWEDEGANPAASFKKRGMTFPTLVEGDDVARNLFGVKGTPTTVFIDKKGNIVAKTRVSDPTDPRLNEMAKMLVMQ